MNKDVVHKYHGILVLKKNAQSVLMRWMSLEPVIRSEVSQENKYRISMHVYGMYEDGADEPICRAVVGMQT